MNICPDLTILFFDDVNNPNKNIHGNDMNSVEMMNSLWLCFEKKKLLFV